VTILGAMRSIQTALSEQLNSFRNEIRAEIRAEITSLRSEMKADQAKVLGEIETLRNEARQNDKRYEERFSRIEADIREIKNDLRQAFRLALPG
jgi:phage-related protein